MSWRDAAGHEWPVTPRRRSPLGALWAVLTRWSLAFPAAGVVMLSIALVTILLSGVSVLAITKWTNPYPGDLPAGVNPVQQYGFAFDGGKPWAPASGQLDVSDRAVTNQAGPATAGEGAAAGTRRIVMRLQFRTRAELQDLGNDAFELQLRVLSGASCGADPQASRWARLDNAASLAIHGLPADTEPYVSLEPGMNCSEVALRLGLLRPGKLNAGADYTAVVDVPAGPVASIGTTLTAVRRTPIRCDSNDSATRVRCVPRELALQSGPTAQMLIGQSWAFHAPGCRRWFSGATTSFPCLPATGTRIMTLGDSVASGTRGEYTWRYRAWQKLHISAAPNWVGQSTGPWTGEYAVPRTRWDSAHDARYGVSAEDTEPKVSGLMRLERPDLVLIDLGTNDTHPFRGLTAKRTAAILDRIIRDVQAGNPDVQILIAQPAGHAATAPSIMADLAARITTVANQRQTSRSQVGVVDLRTNWIRGIDTYDGTHPSQIGEYLIAQRVVDQLAAVFAFGGRFGSIPTVPAPPPPRQVRVRTNGDEIQVSWNTVTQAAQYRVYLRDTTTGSRFELAGPGVRNPKFAGRVVSGHSYEYYVTTVSSGLESNPSPVGRVIAT